MSCRWAWVLQDALGIAFCLYMLKTIRLPTFKVSAGRARLRGSVGSGGPSSQPGPCGAVVLVGLCSCSLPWGWPPRPVVKGGA